MCERGRENSFSSFSPLSYRTGEVVISLEVPVSEEMTCCRAAALFKSFLKKFFI